MSTLVFLIASLLLPETPRLAVIQDAPDFTLTSQEKKELRLRDLQGKVLLVGFVFTTCSGTCPATTSRMVQIQERIKDNGVRLLSITLDPARDTPEVLSRYAKMYDADTGNWTFLTGERERVHKVITDWGMWAKPAANGQLDHPSRIFLVDKKGRIREIYDLAHLKAAWVAEDIEELLKE